MDLTLRKQTVSNEKRFKSVNDGDETSRLDCESPFTMKRYKFLNEDIEIKELVIEMRVSTNTKENVLRESMKQN